VNEHAIVITTDNRRETFALLAEEIVNLGMDTDVISVNGNWPEGTGHLAGELVAQYESVSAIHHAGKVGQGTAQLAGMNATLRGGIEAILTLDPDFSHHPRNILDQLVIFARLDVVIRPRYAPGGTPLLHGVPYSFEPRSQALCLHNLQPRRRWDCIALPRRLPC
jgi:dolichol-phosphate mannosyltransferase